jgi:DNA-binding transcriptional LysR family regulator
MAFAKLDGSVLGRTGIGFRVMAGMHKGPLFALPSDKTMIDLRHLRFFTVVAEKLGVRRAAESLRLRPSTLSYHLQVLEDQIGVRLFDRRRGGLELTGAGRHFLESAHRILFELERAVTDAGRFGRAEAGRLGLGFFTSLASGRLPDLLQSYRQAFPGVEVFLIEGNRVDLLGRLRDRRLDVVLVAGCLDGEDGIEALALWDERLLAVLPDGHPLVAMGGIRWSQLGRERVRWPRNPGQGFKLGST